MEDEGERLAGLKGRGEVGGANRLHRRHQSADRPHTTDRHVPPLNLLMLRQHLARGGALVSQYSPCSSSRLTDYHQYSKGTSGISQSQ